MSCSAGSEAEARSSRNPEWQEISFFFFFPNHYHLSAMLIMKQQYSVLIWKCCTRTLGLTLHLLFCMIELKNLHEKLNFSSWVLVIGPPSPLKMSIL